MAGEAFLEEADHVRRAPDSDTGQLEKIVPGTRQAASRGGRVRVTRVAHYQRMRRIEIAVGITKRSHRNAKRVLKNGPRKDDLLARGSFMGTIHPSRPSSRFSGKPPTRVTSTGNPSAMSSRQAKESASR